MDEKARSASVRFDALLEYFFEVEFISHKEFLNSFCRSQLPLKSVNLSFTIADIRNKLTDFVGIDVRFGALLEYVFEVDFPSSSKQTSIQDKPR